MKRFILPALVIVMAAAIGFGIVFALTKPKTNTTDHHNQSAPAKITRDESVKDQPADQTVSLQSDKATPDEVSNKVGHVLQFNANDDKSHRLAFGEGGTGHEHTSKTDSGIFKPGEGWRVRFDKPGTYFFHDHFNPNINILVVAYNPKTNN